jgi:hypothetical protein
MFVKLSSALCNKLERQIFIQKVIPKIKTIFLNNDVRVNFDSAVKVFKTGFRFQCQHVLITSTCIFKTKNGQRLLLENAKDLSITLGSTKSRNILLLGKNLHSLTFYPMRESVHKYPNRFATYFGQNWVLLCSFLSKDIHKCLTYISFSGIIYIDDKTILNLVKHFKGQLITLNLHGCEDLTDQSITHVAELCVLLKDLDVGGIPLLTDTSIHSLAAHAISLTTLVLGPNFEEPAHRQTTRVTTAAIKELVKQRGHGLSSLSLGKLADSGLLQQLAM